MHTEKEWLQLRSDMVVVMNSLGKIEHISPSTEEIIGYTAEIIFGLTYEDLIHPEDINRLLKHRRKGREYKLM